MASWENIKVSINIVERVPQYLEFLQTYSNNPEWQRDDVLKRALNRYEQMWLPLVAQLRHKDLEPPRDVKWVWHLHMLKPTHYHNYCLERFGYVVPHKIRSSASDERYARERTAGIWKDKYLREPYELEPSLHAAAKYSRSSRLVEQITELSSEHTPALVYQYALHHYRDRTFREGALRRYRQFLHLWHVHGTDIQLPALPYDIQLMWRVHCMYPVEYYHNIAALAMDGAVLDLSDLTGRSHMANAWTDTYAADPLEAGGTGFRGTGHCSIDTFPTDKIPEQKVESCDIILNDIVVSDFWSGEKSFVIEAKRLGDTSFSYTSIFMRDGTVARTISSTDEERGLGSIVFHSKYHRGLEFHLFVRKGSCCRRREHHIATVFYNPRDTCIDGSFITQALNVNIPKISATDPTVKFSMKIKASAKESTVLSMDRGAFRISPLPDRLREFVDMQALWETIHGEEGDYPVITARHSLRSKQSDLQMSAEVIKCDQAELGAVMMHVRSGDREDRLVAVAHSIGQEQLPSGAQVGADFPVTLDPERGDQAMLIRNAAAGDWAVVLGRWQQDPNDGGGDGQVLLTFVTLTDHRDHLHDGRKEFVVRDDEMQHMELGDVRVDMPTGRITVAADCTHIAESVTMAFCAGMIFLTCQKRALQQEMPPTMSLSASSKSLDSMVSNISGGGGGSRSGTGARYTKHASGTAAKMSKKKSRRRKMSASFTFLLANGLQMDSYYYSGPAPPPAAAITHTQPDVILSKAGDVVFASTHTSKSGFSGAKGGLGASLSSFGSTGRVGGGTDGHHNGHVHGQHQHNGGQYARTMRDDHAPAQWDAATEDTGAQLMDIRL